MELKNCYPLGLGSFGYGEQSLVDSGISEDVQLDTLEYTFSKGVNYIVGYMTYANGHTAQLLATAIQKYFKNRDDYFLTFCAYPRLIDPSVSVMKSDTQSFIEMNKGVTLDCYMASMQLEGSFGREQTTKLMKEALDSGMAKTLGLTNASLEQLTYYTSVFGNTIVLHEICHNFEIRTFETLGIIEKGNEYGIKQVIYQPLRRNRTAKRNWPLLVTFAEKYNTTQNQIILSWLISKGFLPLIKSVTKQHIDENCNATEIKLSDEDIKSIDNYVIEWNIPPLNWLDFKASEYNNLYVARLPNVFDELHPKN